MKTVLVIFFSICITCFSIGQKSLSISCKGTCTIDPIIEIKEKAHYIFTGSDTTGLNVTMTKITVVEGRKEKVRKRKDQNCQSPNPEDCMIEVWEEIPPVTMNMYTLPGPDGTREYDMRIEKIKEVKRNGGNVEESIICPKNRSANLLKKVQKSLINLGYPLTLNGILDQPTLLALTDFQKSKNLPYGDLTLSAVAALGIK